MYGVSLSKTKPRPAHTCRESMTRGLFTKMRGSRTWKDGIRYPNRYISIILSIKATNINKNRKTVSDNLMQFTTLLLNEITARFGPQNVGRFDLELEYTEKGTTQTRKVIAHLPRFVLHNPVFPSFYLGVLRGIVTLKKQVESESLTEFLGLVKGRSRWAKISSMPLGAGNWEARLKLFLDSYKDVDLLVKMLDRKNNGPYNTGPGGFIEWCQKQGM